MSELEKETGLKYPVKDGWYWVLFEGYSRPTPCSFSRDEHNEDSSCFLPGGMGDESSMGVYLDEIQKIGEEIIEPEL